MHIGNWENCSLNCRETNFREPLQASQEKKKYWRNSWWTPRKSRKLKKVQINLVKKILKGHLQINFKKEINIVVRGFPQNHLDIFSVFPPGILLPLVEQSHLTLHHFWVDVITVLIYNVFSRIIIKNGFWICVPYNIEPNDFLVSQKISTVMYWSSKQSVQISRS